MTLFCNNDVTYCSWVLQPDSLSSGVAIKPYYENDFITLKIIIPSILPSIIMECNDN